MTTTPLMGLVLPTDHDSADIWDTILDTVFSRIDSHNHTTGLGAKILTGALTIDADVSWSSTGTSRAITDLLAIDFKPSPAANVVSLAGALFVSDGTSGLTINELYWRTTSGTNVKMTAGAALNVAAFTGGIGGDYASTGALVVFDDATDSYWFQQQIGAAVRQYARMRSADVDLYEFKASPAAGVPTNRVRLASPTALAASYALTFPAALPATPANVVTSAAGVLTFVTPPIRTATCSLAGAVAPAVIDSSGRLQLQNSPAEQTIPLITNVGETITSWSLFVIKATNATHTLTARLVRLTMATGVPATVGASQSTSVAGPGAQVTLTQSGLTELVASGIAYYIGFIGDGVVVGDAATGYQFSVI